MDDSPRWTKEHIEATIIGERLLPFDKQHIIMLDFAEYCLRLMEEIHHLTATLRDAKPVLERAADIVEQGEPYDGFISSTAPAADAATLRALAEMEGESDG